MAQAGAPLYIVQYWRKKSSRSFSNDVITSVISKGFEAMEVVLTEPINFEHIRHSLISLDNERLSKRPFDDKINDTVRDLMYGLFQCLHLTLQQLVEHKNEQTIAKSSDEAVDDSNFVDPEGPSGSKIVKKGIDKDVIKEEPLDPLDGTCGAQLALISNPRLHPDMTPKEEELDLMESMVEKATREFVSNQSQSQSTQDITVKSEIREYSPLEMKSNDESMEDSDFEESEGNEEPVDDSDFVDREGPSESKSVKRRKINIRGRKLQKCKMCDFSTRSLNSYRYHLKYLHNTTRGLKGTQLLNENESTNLLSGSDMKTVNLTHKFDHEEFDEPEAKKPRVMKTEVRQDNQSLIKCPDCKTFTTYSPNSFILHYRTHHKKTMGKASIFFRCDCGNESQSPFHQKYCPGQFSLVYKEPCTLVKGVKCVNCKIRPTTIVGYMKHLKVVHRQALSAVGIYLMCSCGLKITSGHSIDNQHTQRCGGRDFSVHRLEDDQAIQELART